MWRRIRDQYDPFYVTYLRHDDYLSTKQNVLLMKRLNYFSFLMKHSFYHLTICTIWFLQIGRFYFLPINCLFWFGPCFIFHFDKTFISKFLLHFYSTWLYGCSRQQKYVGLTLQYVFSCWISLNFSIVVQTITFFQTKWNDRDGQRILWSLTKS